MLTHGYKSSEQLQPLIQELTTYNISPLHKVCTNFNLTSRHLTAWFLFFIFSPRPYIEAYHNAVAGASEQQH